MESSLIKKSFKERLLGGFLWTAGTQIGIIFLTLIYNILMARLLNPKDFGLVTSAQIFTGLVSVLFSLGLGTAIIQKKDVDQATLSSVFWINLGIGFATAIIAFNLAAPIARYFAEDKVGIILKFMSLNFVIGSLSAVPIAILSRNLNFKKLGIATLSAMALAYPLALVLAFSGYAFWSIVFGNFLQILFSSIFYWLAAKWKPAFLFSVASVKSILSFGFFKTLLGIANYFIKNIDYFLIAKLLGTEALGFYTVAFQISSMAAKKYRDVFSLVAFPAFSQIQDEKEKFKTGFYKMAYMGAIILLPVSAIILLFSKDFILLFYGSRWQKSIMPLQVLSLAIIFQVFSNQADSFMMALGNVKKVFYLFLLESILLFGCILVTIRFNIVGVSIALTFTAIVISVVKFGVFKKHVDVAVGEFIRIMAKPFWVVIAISISFTLYRRFVFSGAATKVQFFANAGLVLGILAVSLWIVLGHEEKTLLKKTFFKFLG